jgi:hypothetical protein
MKSKSSSGCGKKSFHNDGKPCGTCYAFFRMMWFPSSVISRARHNLGLDFACEKMMCVYIANDRHHKSGYSNFVAHFVPPIVSCAASRQLFCQLSASLRAVLPLLLSQREKLLIAIRK